MRISRDLVADIGTLRSSGKVHFISASPAGQLQAVIDAGGDNLVIMLEPGEYDEVIDIPAACHDLTLIGFGGRGSSYIQPSTVNATAIYNHAADVTLVNVDATGNGTGYGMENTGRRLRAYGCKFEGGAIGLLMRVASVLEKAAHTDDDSSDCKFEDCEFAWSTLGVKFYGSDYGAVTQAHFFGCLFHGLPTAAFEEGHQAGGANALHYAGLVIDGCTFGDGDDAGTLPTKWISLNDSNSNSGLICRNVFPAAINSGRNLVSTLCLWVGNFHPAAISAAQPS